MPNTDLPPTLARRDDDKLVAESLQAVGNDSTPEQDVIALHSDSDDSIASSDEDSDSTSDDNSSASDMVSHDAGNTGLNSSPIADASGRPNTTPLSNTFSSTRYHSLGYGSVGSQLNTENSIIADVDLSGKNTRSTLEYGCLHEIADNLYYITKQMAIPTVVSLTGAIGLTDLVRLFADGFPIQVIRRVTDITTKWGVPLITVPFYFVGGLAIMFDKLAQHDYTYRPYAEKLNTAFTVAKALMDGGSAANFFYPFLMELIVVSVGANIPYAVAGLIYSLCLAFGGWIATQRMFQGYNQTHPATQKSSINAFFTHRGNETITEFMNWMSTTHEILYSSMSLAYKVPEKMEAFGPLLARLLGSFAGGFIGAGFTYWTGSKLHKIAQQRAQISRDILSTGDWASDLSSSSESDTTDKEQGLETNELTALIPVQPTSILGQQVGIPDTLNVQQHRSETHRHYANLGLEGLNSSIMIGGFAYMLYFSDKFDAISQTVVTMLLYFFDGLEALAVLAIIAVLAKLWSRIGDALPDASRTLASGRLSQDLPLHGSHFVSRHVSINRASDDNSEQRGSVEEAPKAWNLSGCTL